MSPIAAVVPIMSTSSMTTILMYILSVNTKATAD